MAETQASDAVIAFPAPRRVVVGSGEEQKEYVIQTFKMGKTLVILERLSALLEEDAVAEITGGGDWKKVIVQRLPQLLRTARPKLFELFSLILTPNRELIQKNEDGTLDDHVKALSKELIYVAETPDAFAILNAGMDAMGLDVLVKNLESLTTTISAATEKAAD